LVFFVTGEFISLPPEQKEDDADVIVINAVVAVDV
jgi:hypothetical protein